MFEGFILLIFFEGVLNKLLAVYSVGMFDGGCVTRNMRVILFKQWSMKGKNIRLHTIA